MIQLPSSLADLVPPDHPGSAQYTPRSGGLHVSTIVRDLCSTLNPKAYPPLVRSNADAMVGMGITAQDREVASVRQQLGLAFEDVLGAAFGARLMRPSAWRPGEVQRDGITGTPDWNDLDDDGQLAVVECKLTWLSLSKLPIDSGAFQYWLWQGKSYCAMQEIPRLRLYVLFVNGDYTFEPPKGGPQFRVFQEDYTARELEEHWQMMTAHAARLRKGGRA